MTTERKELKKQILTLRGQGLTYRQIADQMTQAGVMNPQSQKPYTAAWVQYIVKANDRRSPRRKTEAATTPRRPVHTGRTNREKVISAIAGMHTVKAEDRLALIELVSGL